MANNKLTLRNTASPYGDIVKGRVLSWSELDNNFITLKGFDITSGVLNGSTLTLNKRDGDQVMITGFGGGGTGSTLNTYVSGGTYSGDTIVFTNTTGGTFSVTGITAGGGSGSTMYTSTDNFTSGVTRTISHNLGSSDVMVQLNYNDELIFGEVTNFQINSVDVTLNQTLNNVKTHVLGGPITAISAITGSDTYVTGGTYSGNEIVFTNNSGGTFSVTGITAGSTGTTSGNTIFSSTNDYVSGVTQTITHNLNSVNVLAQLVDTNNNEMIVGYIDNYQLNSLDVTLSDTLNDIKIVIVGGPVSGGTGGGTDVFVTGGTYNGSELIYTNTTGGTFTITGVTGGGTGSTSPAGSDTWVQFNDGGSFGATSGLTYSTLSGGTFTAISNRSTSGITTDMGFTVGTNNDFGLPSGIGSFYQSSAYPTSAVVSVIGDLIGYGITDLATFNGIFDFMGGSNGITTTTGGTRISVNDPLANVSNIKASIIDGTEMYYSSGSSSNGLSLNGNGVSVNLDPSSSSLQSFSVYGNNNLALFRADYSPLFNYSGITFFEQYTFPTTSGNSGDVLYLTSGGNLEWTGMTSGSGGTSIMIEGVGLNSTMRDGVSNTASGSYSAALGGRGNVASGNYSTVAGGRCNTASAYSSFIGGGRCIVASGTYSTVGGGFSNAALGDYSTVAGQNNTATGQYSTIAGGILNTASGAYGYSSIGGGRLNTASGTYSTIAGGWGNAASGNYSTVAGGRCNTASGAYGSHIGGGLFNAATGVTSTIAGGSNNTASNYSFVGGGRNNTANAATSTIAGGENNTTSCQHSTVGGGLCNAALGFYSFVGGGRNNIATCGSSTVSGGYDNAATNQYSTVAGGSGNTATGSYSAILGGSGNTASGAYSSVLGGVGLTASFNTAAVPNLDINGDLRFIGTSTATTATIGTGGAIPSSAATYVTITLDGTNYKLPLFNT